MENSTKKSYCNLGVQLAKAREKSHKTVPQFADKLRISKNTLTNYEYEYTKAIPFSVIQRCCEICNLPFEFFSEGKEISDFELYKKIKKLSPRQQVHVAELIEMLLQK